MSTEELLHHRMLKYRSIGGFQEGVPVEPQRKRSMKQSDVNTTTSDLEYEILNLKKKIIEAKGPTDPVASDAIEKLKEEVDKDITNAFISMGLEEKLESVKLELSRSSNRPDQPLSGGLKEKVDTIMQEFKNKFSQPGAYLGLKKKLEELNSISRLIELKQKRDKLKAEINQKLHNEMKDKMELIKNAEEKISRGEDLDKRMLEEVESAKDDLKEILKSTNLEIVGIRRRNLPPLPPELEDEIVSVNKEINKEIEKAILAAGLSSKIEQLKAQVLNGSPPEHLQKLQAEIKEEILSALNAEHLKEKVEDIRSKLAQSTGSSTKIGGDNGRY